MAQIRKSEIEGQNYRLRLMMQNSAQRVYSLYNIDDELIKTYIINVLTSSEVEAFRKQLLLEHMDMATQPDAIIESVEAFDKHLDALLSCPIRLL